MKKPGLVTSLLTGLLLVPSLLLASCTAPGVSQENFDQLLEKQDQTLEKLEQLTGSVPASTETSPSKVSIWLCAFITRQI